MRYGLVADIHSNLEAFEAVLTHAHAQGVGRMLLLGDLIGYGADPEAVLERCMELVASRQAQAILGNHDALACGRAPCDMNADAQQALEWNRTRLKPRHFDFLMRLPLMVREERFCAVHASAYQPEAWHYVSTGHEAEQSLHAAGTDWVFSGHVHDPTLYYTGRDEHMFSFRPTENIPVPVPNHRSWLAIVGSCGQPRDRKVGARYAVFDSTQQKLTFFRVPYDHHAAAQKIRAVGLPPRLADYVEGLA